MVDNQWSRVVTLAEGVAMVVTDLHGDWDAYRRYRDAFLRGYEAGDIQHLIFSGDLVHREAAPQFDKSLEMVLDVMTLQAAHPGAITYLCGNHEFPHIYHIILAKGNFVYTPSFESRLGEYRQQVIDFFKSLPFYVRTAAGVSITHAGASDVSARREKNQQLFSFDHQTIFDNVERILAGKDRESLRNGMARFSGESYEFQARSYLAVTGRGDPRYDDLLRGFIASSDPEFGTLWNALFSRCEKEYGQGDYGIFLNALLDALSSGFEPQNFLIAGHINVHGTHEVVAKRHLRVASGKHAPSPRQARCLVFDAGQPVKSMKTLVNQLVSL